MSKELRKKYYALTKTQKTIFIKIGPMKTGINISIILTQA